MHGCVCQCVYWCVFLNGLRRLITLRCFPTGSCWSEGDTHVRVWTTADAGSKSFIVDLMTPFTAARPLFNTQYNIKVCLAGSRKAETYEPKWLQILPLYRCRRKLPAVVWTLKGSAAKTNVTPGSTEDSAQSAKTWLTGKSFLKDQILRGNNYMHIQLKKIIYHAEKMRNKSLWTNYIFVWFAWTAPLRISQVMFTSLCSFDWRAYCVFAILNKLGTQCTDILRQNTC